MYDEHGVMENGGKKLIIENGLTDGQGQLGVERSLSTSTKKRDRCTRLDNEESVQQKHLTSRRQSLFLVYDKKGENHQSQRRKEASNSIVPIDVTGGQ